MHRFTTLKFLKMHTYLFIDDKLCPFFNVTETWPLLLCSIILSFLTVGILFFYWLLTFFPG